MADAYQQHLSRLHAGLETPEPVILAALAQVSRAPIESRRRIVEGEANEVHGFRLADGLEVVMRIARNARGFEQERWAIEACAREGVPVPEILLIQQVESESGRVDLCIQRKLEGELLSNRLDLPRETLRAVTREAGDLLSRVHRVKTTGVGYLNGAGAGPFATYADLMADFLGQEAEFVALAEQTGVEPAAMRRAVGLIADAIDAAPIRTTLIHNDFLPKHLLVKDGRVSGVIDFGEVSAESPVIEFVKWDYFAGEAMPLAWLREGYADKSLFDTDYERLFPALRLMTSVCLLAWYAGEGFEAGVAAAKAALERDLARVPGIGA